MAANKKVHKSVVLADPYITACGRRGILVGLDEKMDYPVSNYWKDVTCRYCLETKTRRKKNGKK